MQFTVTYCYLSGHLATLKNPRSRFGSTAIVGSRLEKRGRHGGAWLLTRTGTAEGRSRAQKRGQRMGRPAETPRRAECRGPRGAGRRARMRGELGEECCCCSFHSGLSGTAVLA